MIGQKAGDPGDETPPFLWDFTPNLERTYIYTYKYRVVQSFCMFVFAIGGSPIVSNSVERALLQANGPAIVVSIGIKCRGRCYSPTNCCVFTFSKVLIVTIHAASDRNSKRVVQSSGLISHCVYHTRCSIYIVYNV